MGGSQQLHGATKLFLEELNQLGEVVVSLSKRNRNGKTEGASQRGTAECQEKVNCSQYGLLKLLPLSSLFTYRQLAPGATDGHNLFTMEGEFLLKALE